MRTCVRSKRRTRWRIGELYNAALEPPSKAGATRLPERDGVGGLVFHRNINERQGGTAQSFVFAEDQCQIAADLSVGQWNRGQHVRLDVLLNVRSRR